MENDETEQEVREFLEEISNSEFETGAIENALRNVVNAIEGVTELASDVKSPSYHQAKTA